MFARLAASASRVSGLPDVRHAFLPHPLVNRTVDELRVLVDGQDPVTKRPFMEGVIDALTRPLPAGVDASLDRRSTPRLVKVQSETDAHEMFRARGWTDQLPIVLPTEERVAEMLAHTSRSPEETVGYLRPTAYREEWESTVEKVAVNAVMAGASPEYFPVILAMAASGVSARPSSTSSPSRMAVVNGPVRDELEMNSGIGAMAPFNHANATIGRAYGLLSQNLQGGSVPEDTYMGSQGNAYSYANVTFPENQEASPWEPFHVEHGFAMTDSTVSIFGGLNSTVYMTGGARRKYWKENASRKLAATASLGSVQPPLLVLDPLVAIEFASEGGFSKADLAHWVWENTMIPAGQFWDEQLVHNNLYPRATNGEEPWASMHRARPDELIHLFKPEEVQIVVVGGGTIASWRMMSAQYFGTFSVDEWR